MGKCVRGSRSCLCDTYVFLSSSSCLSSFREVERAEQMGINPNEPVLTTERSQSCYPPALRGGPGHPAPSLGRWQTFWLIKWQDGSVHAVLGSQGQPSSTRSCESPLRLP